MHHTNRHDVIETGEDIQDILGVHVSEENGQKVAVIKAVLDPRKDFLAVKDLFLHFTNGINHRLLGPFTPVKSPADLFTASSEVALDDEEESGGPTQPLVELAPSKAKKAEVTPNVSTSVDTVKSPSVLGRGEKGI